MKILKITLIAVLILVTGLYGYTTVSQSLSGKGQGPVIESQQELLEVSIHDTQSVLLTGITAWDEQDGDLTGDVMISGISKFITPGTARVSYLVFDSDRNVGTLNRNIRYTDYTAPRMAVTAPLIYYRNESIALLDRISATDVIDGDVTELLRVSPLTATSEPEVYTVDVQVTNSMGDTARLTLPVIQLEGIAIRPEVRLTQYLTYIAAGSSFSARSYLQSVVTPGGSGLKEDVQITGEVDVNTPGTYLVYYTYPYGTTSGTSILTVVVE